MFSKREIKPGEELTVDSASRRKREDDLSLRITEVPGDDQSGT